ncbi:MAG: DNA mismatch repair endonuclease MutL, partial [Clostridia bacterium]|nr:DNA mismatch repair endonuclease MutL [Clostridia bacterium]
MAIKVLSKEITQKISAGEVVERPASIVKELIENSIDAGATNITIEIENGGISYIRVTDNGCGMSSIDSIECFKAHATSKISEETDLYKIATLGFRGEAIPSISAVSRVTLYTRTSGSEFGMKVVNHGGDLIEQEKSGRPEGTTIIVEDVFYNVPARLKFLKKLSAEMAHISSIVQKYILARPDIAFRFISNKKDVFISSGDNNLKNAIQVIYGNEIYSKLIPLTYEYGDIKINGFIGDPEIARATKTMQNLFVNSRYVKSDMISNSIKQGYLNRLMFAKHPFFVVNLYLPFSDIDVNVHPNKLEVRFKEEGIIQECFFKAVKAAFENLKLEEDTPFYETEKPKIIEVAP